MSHTFWQSCLPTIHSMLLHGKGPLLDSLERPEILSYLPPLQNKSVLDLGSGIGRFTESFAELGAKEIVAVDFSSDFLEENRRRNRAFSQIRYICQNATHFEAEHQSFDLIFISWLFQYLEDASVQKLIQNFTHWLKPGGHLFFRESISPTLLRKEGEYFAIYRRFIDYPRFFSKRWTLVREGNILAYEEIESDPFKGYWLYRLGPR